MPSPALIAGIGAGASLVGGLFNRGSENKIARENREWQEKMWNMNNEYNQPIRQRERLIAGGFNPNLLYGNGTIQNTSDNQQMPDQHYNTPLDVGGAVTNYFDLQTRQAQYDNILKTNQAIEADIANKNANTANTLTGTARSVFDLDMLKELRQTSIDGAIASTKGLQLNNARTELDTKQMPERHIMAMKQGTQSILNSIATRGLQEIDKILREEQLKLRKQGIEISDPYYVRQIARAVTSKHGQSVGEKIKKTLNSLGDEKKLKKAWKGLWSWDTPVGPKKSKK